MYPRHATVSLLSLLLVAGTGSATTLDGATLYKDKTCISCHGPDAKTPVLPVYPKLAGQNPDYLFQQLQDIKKGIRKNALTPAMNGIMQTVNEQEMRVLADWLGSLSAE